MKTCGRCNLKKKDKRFSVRSSGKLRGICKDCHNADIKIARAGYKKAIFNNYGWECKCCGESNPVFLTIDHINNDGYLDKMKYGRKRKLTGKDLYFKIIKEGFPKKFQTYCQNCNFGKKVCGICPHQIDGRK